MSEGSGAFSMRAAEVVSGIDAVSSWSDLPLPFLFFFWFFVSGAGGGAPGTIRWATASGILVEGLRRIRFCWVRIAELDVVECKKMRRVLSHELQPCIHHQTHQPLGFQHSRKL